MVSSTLNPQAIIKTSKATPSSFGSFMTGEKFSSNSPIINASNNIVKFGRVNIQPSQSNISNIITNISTNIIKQVNSSLQNVITYTQKQIDGTLSNFEKDYSQKIKTFEDTRPNNVLSKFLGLYNNAIGFITFFGDNKNIKTIETNLKALRKIFEESFEVAFILRQTIIKIVKQLSNLPTASAKSGGLDLDIKIPGGKLKQGAQPKVKNVGRMAARGGMLGAGLLGLGGLGMATYGMEKAKEYQESKLEEGISPFNEEQYIPGNIVESFSSIVDRFVSAVNSLIGGDKKKTTGGGGGDSYVAPSSPPPSSNDPTTPNPGVSQMSSLTGVHKEAAEIIKKYESSGGNYNSMNRGSGGDSPEGPIKYFNKNLTDMTIGEVINLQRLGKLNAAGAYQFVENTLPTAMRQAGLTENDKFDVLNQDKMFVAHLQKAGHRPWTGPWGMNKYSSEELKTLERAVKTPVAFNVSNTSTTQEPQVSPAPTQTQTIQERARSISQPAQQVPQTISLPPTIIDAGGGQQQTTNGGIQTIPAQGGTNSYQVPILPTTNPDNFLTMYSRIVYNIVDG